MPDWEPEIRKRLVSLRLEAARETEIVEELAQHLDDRYERLTTTGATKDEAYHAVMVELTESDRLARELLRLECPDSQETPLGTPGSKNIMADFWQDLRYGLRTLLKNPSFTAVAVIALALGIGANTAIFSAVNAILLQPLPYKDPEQLLMVWEDASVQGFPHNVAAAGNFNDWRVQNQVFEGLAAIGRKSFNLTGAGDPERVDGREVSGNLFQLLGVEPQLGRPFAPEEDQPGGNRVVILSHALWQRRFGSDPTIVGKPLTINGESHTVIGVMPARFKFPSREDELWVPLVFDSKQAADRGRHYLEVVARLKSGMTLAQAQAEMSTIAARLQQQFPGSNTNLGVALTSLHEEVVGDIRPALFVLLGAVGFVLLMACANVANLLLARAAVRQKEIATRLALGANRRRLLRQFLTESILLSLLGGIVGLLLALAGIYLLKTFIPANISQASAITIDPMVLAFTLLVSLLTGLIFGLAPAAQACTLDLNEALKEGGRDSTAGHRGNRLRSALVIAEVAVAFVLLIGAGLMINSFLRLRYVEPGFRAENLLTMSVVLPEQKYSDPGKRSAFYDELVHRVEALPGVQSAAVVNWIPLVLQGDSFGISIEGRPEATVDKRPEISTRTISPHYLGTMGIQLSQGRQFEEHDRADSPYVAIVSETMARRLWPGENAVGKRIKPGPSNSKYPWIEIVGVATDVRQLKLDADPKMQMYLPYEQFSFFPPRHLVVRTDVDLRSLAATVRSTVWAIDKEQPVSNMTTMEDLVSESLARQRFSMLLLAIFAGLALVLAAVGIYGVMSYSVAQRTHEFGLRIALGAQGSDVLRLAVGHGLRLVLIGVAIGLTGSFYLTRVMSSLLFGVSATDPPTFIIISLVLIAVALLASYIPARRATKVDPIVALR
jgi:putative ABC transport system permease protein